MASDDTKEEIARLLGEQPEDTRRLISEVLQIEREKRHQERVIGARDEIVAVIKDIVK